MCDYRRGRGMVVTDNPPVGLDSKKIIARNKPPDL